MWTIILEIIIIYNYSSILSSIIVHIAVITCVLSELGKVVM